MKDQITFTTDPKVFLESGREVVYLERIDSGMLVHFPKCFFGGADEEACFKIITDAHKNLYSGAWAPSFSHSKNNVRVELVKGCLDKNEPFNVRKPIKELSNDEILTSARIFAEEAAKLVKEYSTSAAEEMKANENAVVDVKKHPSRNLIARLLGRKTHSNDPKQ